MYCVTCLRDTCVCVVETPLDFSLLTGDPDWKGWLEGLRARGDACTVDESRVLSADSRGVYTAEEYSLAAALYARETHEPRWLGQPKDRINVDGCQCTEIRDLGVHPDHPEWGGRFLIRFTAASGHALVWFASEGGKFDPKVGGTYNIRATVVKHDEYEGRYSTVVNRCAERR